MYIHLKVLTKQSKEKIEKVSEDHYKISLREEAKRNQANRRILEILGELFPGSIVRIINGHNSPSKLVSIEPRS